MRICLIELVIDQCQKIHETDLAGHQRQDRLRSLVELVCETVEKKNN